MRIAHVTDFHLRHHQPGTSASPRRRSRHVPRLLSEMLDRIGSQHVDMIAVTGDLLDVPGWLIDPVPGFEGDAPDAWREAALRDYRLVKDMLDATGLPWMVLPGNHDAPPLMWQVFDEHENAIELADRRVVRFCDHEHTAHFPRRFHPERARFDAELAAPSPGQTNGHPNPPRQVHLQHYVLTPVLNQGYPHTYAESESLVSRITRSGRVALSLSGHYHRGTDLIACDGTTFATGPAACEPPFRWRVVELEDGSDRVTMESYELGHDAQPPRPVVFLDRDGVINDRASYRSGPEDMTLLPGVGRAVGRLNDAGYAVVVVTNQSCVGGGYVPEAVMHAVHDRMTRLLCEAAGAWVDAIYAATGAGERAVLPRYRDTAANKPHPTMLEKAMADLNLIRAKAWLVGDAVSDARAAEGVGAQPILVRTGHGQAQAEAFKEAFPDGPILADLPAAVAHILAD